MARRSKKAVVFRRGLDFKRHAHDCRAKTLRRSRLVMRQLHPRTLSSARHAVVVWHAGRVAVCWRIFFCISSFLRVHHELHRGIRWKIKTAKCLSKLLKIPWISSPPDTFVSNCSSNLHLLFCWKCPLHPHSYNTPGKHHLPLLKVWQLRLSDFTPLTITRWLPSSVVSQPSFHVVTHYVHASVIAWWLKTKALDICDESI